VQVCYVCHDVVGVGGEKYDNSGGIGITAAIVLNNLFLSGRATQCNSEHAKIGDVSVPNLSEVLKLVRLG
jgi:hypothetical protein